MPLRAEFGIEEKEFAAGGFRKAVKATNITEGFNKGTWVVKSYLETAVQLIKDTGQTTEEHTKKSVQMISSKKLCIPAEGSNCKRRIWTVI